MVEEVKVRRRDLYAALTRNAVLEAAEMLFVEPGFAPTSVDDIARAAGVSKGAVYHHFTDKREIFAAVFSASQERVIFAAGVKLSSAEHAWDGLAAATRGFLRAYVADESARAILRQAVNVIGWDRAREIDEATALPLIRATLAEFSYRNEVKIGQPDHAAELIFGLYCNAVLTIAAADNPEIAADHIETLVLALMSGLRA